MNGHEDDVKREMSEDSRLWAFAYLGAALGVFAAAWWMLDRVALRLDQGSWLVSADWLHAWMIATAGGALGLAVAFGLHVVRGALRTHN